MNSSRPTAPVSVAIPTYGREQVLVDTLGFLLRQSLPAAEIIVVDQTREHEPLTKRQLETWHAAGIIRWIPLDQPSQPGALNHALSVASQSIVLFLDDDIEISPDFVAAHARSYENPDTWAVVGQVLQPGEEELYGYAHGAKAGPLADLDFPFRSAEDAWVFNGMSGNLSVRRDKALEIGGFDENFPPPVSYRFDSDFCKRLIKAGGRIRFDPEARIHHLRAERGGTRSNGNHLTSASPLHGVGDYYFALRQGLCAETLRYVLKRPFREVRTRFHLKHPWWIPVKLFGELRALFLAVKLFRSGPKLLMTDRLV